MAATGVDQLSGPLAQIVGEGNVLTEANAARFSGDALGPARGSTQFGAAPASDFVVVRPGETPEITAVIRIANERGIAIVPHGSDPAKRAAPPVQPMNGRHAAKEKR